MVSNRPSLENLRRYEVYVNMQRESVAALSKMPPRLLQKEDAELIEVSFSPDAKVRQASIPLLVRAGTKPALQRVKGMQVDEDAGVRAAAQNVLKAYESEVELKKAA